MTANRAGNWDVITRSHSSCILRCILTPFVDAHALSCPLVIGSSRTHDNARSVMLLSEMVLPDEQRVGVFFLIIQQAILMLQNSLFQKISRKISCLKFKLDQTVIHAKSWEKKWWKWKESTKISWPWSPLSPPPSWSLDLPPTGSTSQLIRISSHEWDSARESREPCHWLRHQTVTGPQHQTSCRSLGPRVRTGLNRKKWTDSLNHFISQHPLQSHSTISVNSET